ncbi:MAG TPA: hypothetical protein VFG42_12140 [Baekduia sp.]|uniref:hypothetical protein n=1 Tax=Baekduia sp. TaxID=2600305 RepID=UPI002D799546|nr:hypothetical protein [Baekduia sp.]HET6507529.1 hypothetical protein [Baekduia sp.]
MSKTARNVLILVAVAAVVAFLPGGGDAAGLVLALLSIGIMTAFVLLGIRFYRENRVAVFSLGDQHRAIAYASLGAVVVAFAGRSKLTQTAIGSVVLVLLFAGAVAGAYAVWRHHRSYGY